VKEDRFDDITYDENWQRFDEPVAAVMYDNPDEETQKRESGKPRKKRERTFPALITIQLVLCLLVAFLVFMLKAMNSDTYQKLCDWYDKQMENTLISDTTFEDIDLSEYFESSIDEAKPNSNES